MSEYHPDWRPAKPEPTVPKSDYDALAQQLAASEEIKDGMRHEIRGLSYELAARDKQLADAVGLLKGRYISGWSIRVDAFLTTIEQDKAND